MRYMCLIYENEAESATRSAEQQAEIMAQYMNFTEQLVSSGVMEGGAPLLATDPATTVRVRGGKATHTDGPFAETKEQLGGYYLLNCKDLDEALTWAAKIPSAAFGSVEVRPVMEVGD